MYGLSSGVARPSRVGLHLQAGDGLSGDIEGVLRYAHPPEYTRDIGEQEIYFDLLENARRLIVKARTFESEL